MEFTQADRLAVLKAARERIEDPSRWCRYSALRNKDDKPIEHPPYDAAVQFSLDGAIMVELAGRQIPDDEKDSFWDELETVAMATLSESEVRAVVDFGEKAIMLINDHQNHERVLAFLDNLIAIYSN